MHELTLTIFPCPYETASCVNRINLTGEYLNFVFLTLKYHLHNKVFSFSANIQTEGQTFRQLDYYETIDL